MKIINDKKIDVVCLGLFVRDIILSGIEEDALQKDTSQCKSMMMTYGGDAANEATVLSHLGDRAALLSVCGKQADENIAIEIYNEGVDTSLLIRKDNAAVINSIVAVRCDGSRSFIFVPCTENAHIKEEDVTDEILNSTKVLSVGSLFVNKNLDGKPITDILRRARSFGAITVCDMMQDIYGKGNNANDSAYQYIDFLMPSEEEAYFVSGKNSPEDAAKYFLNLGAKNVIIKLGERGSYFRNKEEQFYTEAFNITPVDTTGCGDTFVASFIHGILHDMDNKEALRFASAAGAINALQKGAHHAVKSHEQIMEFLGKNNKL